MSKPRRASTKNKTTDAEAQPADVPLEVAAPATPKSRAAAPRPRRGAAKSAGSASGAKARAPRSESESGESKSEQDGEETEVADSDDDAIVGEIAGDDTSVPLAEPAERAERGVARFDPYAAYFREVQRHPLLTPEQEHELAVNYVTTQNVKTAAKLVTSNLRLVVKIAYEYRRAYRNLMDLIQEGNIGLMQAVKRYDPYRGVKLSSYAAWWIRAYILRFILNNWRLVKIGTTQAQRKLFFNLNKERQKLLAMGVDPTPEVLAKRLDVPAQEVSEMDRRLSASDASLDAPIGDGDGRPVSRLDLLASNTELAESDLTRRMRSEAVRWHLERFGKTLKDKEKTIFEQRLVAEDPVTLQEIGDVFGVSRERVRQIEARLQDKLKKYLLEHTAPALQRAWRDKLQGAEKTIFDKRITGRERAPREDLAAELGVSLDALDALEEKVQQRWREHQEREHVLELDPL